MAMIHTLQAHVDVLFQRYPESRELHELKLELLAGLQEKMNDYMQRGHPEEIAYSLTINSIGDVDALIHQVMHSASAHAQKPEEYSRLSDRDQTPASDFQGHTNLRGAILKRVNLSGENLSGVDLRDSDLSYACLDGADLSGIRLSDSELKGTSFRNCNLTLADLRSCNLEGACFDGANLSGTRMAGSSLTGASFQGALLIKTDFCQCDLSDLDFARQMLTDVDFSAAELAHASFREATLQRLKLRDVSAHEADCAGTVMDKITYLLLTSAGAHTERTTVV